MSKIAPEFSCSKFISNLGYGTPPLVVGFFLGIITSAIVGGVFYSMQVRDSDATELKLLHRLAGVLRATEGAHAGTMIIANHTRDIKKEIAILRRQVERAGSALESATAERVRIARNVLGSNLSPNVPSLLRLHQRLLEDEFEYAGTFRDVAVYVPGVTENGRTIPAANMVPSLTEALLREWRDRADTLRNSPSEVVAEELAKLHFQLLRIHPFFDGNGLVARILLALQAESLLGTQVLFSRTDAAYLNALSRASEDEAHALARLLLVMRPLSNSIDRCLFDRCLPIRIAPE